MCSLIKIGREYSDAVRALSVAVWDAHERTKLERDARR
jgi:hypothetical protein